MRLAFCGTPTVALPTLDLLADHVRVVLTRPPTPRGRGRQLRPSPVEERARRLGIPVATPEAPGEIRGALVAHGPLDAVAVVAYGLLIPPDALAVPRRGFVNLHFSLLPRWRGAAPVQRALLAGDRTTGVSIMRIDEGLDTGPLLAVSATMVGSEEDAGSLTARLAETGARLMREVLAGWVEGSVVEVAQPREGATTAPKITDADRRLAFDQPPEAFVRRVRAMAPTPGAVARHRGAYLKVLAARPAAGEADPGELIFDGKHLYCGVAGGSVELVTVQPAGKPPMSGAAWARGRREGLGRLE